MNNKKSNNKEFNTKVILWFLYYLCIILHFQNLKILRNLFIINILIFVLYFSIICIFFPVFPKEKTSIKEYFNSSILENIIWGLILLLIIVLPCLMFYYGIFHEIFKLFSELYTLLNKDTLFIFLLFFPVLYFIIPLFFSSKEK